MPARHETVPPLRAAAKDTAFEPPVKPRPTSPRVPLLCVGAALIAMSIVTEPIGAQWIMLCLLGALAIVAVPPGTRDDRAGRPLLRGLPTIALVLALSAAAAVSTDGLLVGLCLTIAAVIAVTHVLPAGRGLAMSSRAIAFAAATTQSVPWLIASLRHGRTVAGAGVVRTGLMVLPALAVLGLLASADPTFAEALRAMVPVSTVGDPFAYVLAAGLALVFVGTLAHLRAEPPKIATRRPLNRARYEWLVPVATMDAVLLSFLGVRAAELFGAIPTSGAAREARAGFVQLVLVTIVVTLVLRRTVSIASAARGELAAWAAPAYLGTMIVLVSALHRLWSYQMAMGWTVARLEAMAFEVWLGAALVTAALGWWVHRERLVATLICVSAAVSVLALTLVSPAALVADWHVARYARTGTLDVVYLRSLPDDATPQLAVLPESVRCQVLGEAPRTAPWYALNVRREQARAAAAGAQCK